VILLAALACAALATARPAGADLLSGCETVNLFGQGLKIHFEVGNKSFQAGERLTFLAGEPTLGGAPDLMTLAVTDPTGHTTNLSTGFPGTLVYDFPLTGDYPSVKLDTTPGIFTRLSTWNVTRGPAPPGVPGAPFELPGKAAARRRVEEHGRDRRRRVGPRLEQQLHQHPGHDQLTYT
jgi:hypothetical protein